VRFAESRTSPHSLAVLEHSHGAPSRVAPNATAFPARTAPFDLVLISMWTNAEEDARHIKWTREFHSDMQHWSAGSSCPIVISVGVLTHSVRSLDLGLDILAQEVG
jgi:hypothetical protein